MIDMTDNDFGVIMRPVLTVDEEWEGDVQVSVFSNTMPEIDDDTHSQLMFLAYKMSAMVQFCNENPDFDDTLSDYTAAMVDELGLDLAEEIAAEPKDKITSKVGNVITLDFNTKCEGEG